MIETIGPLSARNEDEFLNGIRGELQKEFNLSGDSVIFILKYIIDKDNRSYYTHLNADLFQETNNNKDIKKRNEGYKLEIIKRVREVELEYPELFSIIKSKYKTDLLETDNSNLTTYPLNQFLVEIYQYPADFSMGFLGKFYPFCQLTGRCYKNELKNCTQWDNTFSLETLKKCGVWINPRHIEDANKKNEATKFDVKKLMSIARNKKDKIEILKYYLLSRIENVLFDFSRNYTVSFPIIRRSQCNNLIFISSNRKPEITKSKIKSTIDKVNDYFDNEFYYYFFTQIETEKNFADILAKPEILSKIFNLKTQGNGELISTEKISGEVSKDVSLIYNKGQSSMEIVFDSHRIKFSTNTFWKDFNENECISFFQHFIDSIEQVKIVKNAFYKKNLKTAIISILVDSYSHNISAHSLSALKWWLEQRAKMLEKRIFVGKKAVELKKLQPSDINIERQTNLDVTLTPKTKDTDIFKDNDPLMLSSRKYYETLGLTDSSYNARYYSLFDYLMFANNAEVEKLFRFSKKVKAKDRGEMFVPRFPVPIDYALMPFFRFLRDKGAFWSGVTRDMAFGGESKTWYKILWEDFANNPLYLGTVAKSEGISKLNIFLAIKQRNEDWKQGHFVTIDLSVIDYETKMANNAKLHSKITKHQSYENNIESGCPFKNNSDKCSFEKNIIDEYDYSIYSFVKPGRCFQCFRVILDTPDYMAFMPGGLVGEHALFTIFENTLRNIKHYKESIKTITKDGINFWISIEDNELVSLNNKGPQEGFDYQEDSTKNNGESTKKTELYKVSTWLAHETEIFDNSTFRKLLIKDEKIFLKINRELKELKDIDELTNRFLLKKVTDASLSSILDPDSGSPRMGGNSQDKACAAMLFNNEFKSVERINTERDMYYFPWINYTHVGSTENMIDIEIDHEYRNKEFRKHAFINYLNKLSNKNIGNKGFLKKSFNVWRGEEYYPVENVKNLEVENVSRFKIVVINSDDECKVNTIEEALSEAGVIRILQKTEIKHIDISSIKHEVYNDPIITTSEKDIEIKRRYFRQLYCEWLKKWLNIESEYSICFIQPQPLCRLRLNKIISIKKEPSSLDGNLQLKLSHGTEEEKNSCNVRSHGYFWNYFFSYIKDKSISNLLLKADSYPSVKDHLLCELIETLATRIMIFDNRIYNKFEKLDCEKRKVFGIFLQLLAFNEDINQELKKVIDESSNDYVRNRDKDEKVTINKFAPNVLVLHLSFIESIKKNGINYNEDTIYSFIKDQLISFFNNDPNFILVIITGRGRDRWRKNLLTEDKEKVFINRTYFKPVESLLNAIESGLSYNDDFDVKYNLCKVIFGS